MARMARKAQITGRGSNCPLRDAGYGDPVIGTVSRNTPPRPIG